MNKKTFFLILLGVLVLPLLTSAATLGSMADAAAQTALYVASGVVVVLWVVTGILFLQAQGEPATLSKAKLALMTSIAGTVVVLIANAGAASFVRDIFKI